MTTDVLIGKGPFARLIREIATESFQGKSDMRFQRTVIFVLQEEVEAYLVGWFV
jgi:histone H3/H4